MAKIAFTAGRVSGFKCPPDKKQTFLWDAIAPGLGLRATPAGKPAYVFQSVYQGKDIRITIGSPAAWSIPEAQAKARELQRLIDEGKDPRDLKRDALAAQVEKQAAAAAKAEADKAAALTVGDLWPLYLENGKPKRKDAWKPRYRADLDAMAAPGGEKKKRGQGVKRPGPLFPLMALPLAGINEDTLKSWFDREALSGRHQAARALMMFRGFLRWCAARPEYRSLTDRDAGRAPAILESLPPNTRRVDKLMSEQIAGWWASVEQLHNPVHSAYLRALLLSGARREEIATLEWSRIDWPWKTITIADKFELTRTIPLAPYMAWLLDGLPRQGKYVFHSSGQHGYVKDARSSMERVLADCSVDHLTFHGLRRTFTQVARRIVPGGVPAQISGHKPSATAEGYNILTLDELRPYMAQIEAKFLEIAGVQFDAQAAPSVLRVVAG